LELQADKIEDLQRANEALVQEKDDLCSRFVVAIEIANRFRVERGSLHSALVASIKRKSDNEGNLRSMAIKADLLVKRYGDLVASYSKVQRTLQSRTEARQAYRLALD
jgi:hypothetical protein